MGDINYYIPRVPVLAQWLTILTRNQEVAGSIPDLTQWVKDLVLLWRWRRPVATGPIRPLAWGPPYATGAALEKTKEEKKKKNYYIPMGSGTQAPLFPEPGYQEASSR